MTLSELKNNTICHDIDETQQGWRLDRVLQAVCANLSRQKLQALIRQGMVSVNGQIVDKVALRLRLSDHVVISKQNIISQPDNILPIANAQIPLDVIYEDEHIAIINKQAGLVVHPAAGHHTDTVVNALVARWPDFDIYSVGDSQRPGIVHRLDKDTTGLMIIARSAQAHVKLTDDFAKRLIKRRYYGFVWGVFPTMSGRIDKPIGRSRHNRQKMAIRSLDVGGRAAITDWKTLNVFQYQEKCFASLCQFSLQTGRTHQIRVHCLSQGHGLVGDPVYGSDRGWLCHCPESILDEQGNLPFKRQALHAFSLTFQHPISHKSMSFKLPLPQDMQLFLDALQTYQYL